MDEVKVLSVMRLSEENLETLRQVSPQLNISQITCHKPEEMDPLLGEVEVLYTYYADFDPALAPHLKWIQLSSAGVDHLLDKPVMASDILITTTSGIHAIPIAEYVFASILGFWRQFPRLLRYQLRHEWPHGRWDEFRGEELRGKTMGIIGYGSIGREIGRLARCFGMHVLALKRAPSERADPGYVVAGAGDPAGTIPDAIYAPGELCEMVAQCDVVVICLPLTAETRGFFGKKALRAMKPTAYLVNISRGDVVDEEDLVQALHEGWICGAGLDVFHQEPLPPDHPLYDLENVILTPHISAVTHAYDDRVTALFAENLRRYLHGEELLNIVDRKRGY